MVLQSIKMALKAITSNKLRSFLTMLGIIIGVFALVVLVAIVNGATDYITNTISSIGTDYVQVNIADDKGKPLNEETLKEISKLKGVNEIAPSLTTFPATFVSNGKEKKGILYGATPALFRIQGQKTISGRLFSSVDEDSHSRVAVISYETARKFFNRTNNVKGESIKVNGIKYEVVGVLEKGSGSSGLENLLFGGASTVYIPLSSYTRQPENQSNGYDNLIVSIDPDSNSQEVTDTLTKFFNERFNNDPDAFSIISQDEIGNAMDNVTGMLTLLLGGIAAISLIVGGIGIMNIMLVSVTERTREIGIRKAIGAGTKSILLQFLIEAFVISLTGCLMGLALSYATVAGINAVVHIFNQDINFSIPPYIVLLSVGFSLLVGLIFGLYPANKAAKKKPIEALRYDG